MTDIMASIGLVQLKRYDALLARRREIIGMYDKALESLPVSVLNHFDTDHKSSGHLYLIRVQGKMREECNEIITKMAEHGVATNVHYKPLPLLSAYKIWDLILKIIQMLMLYLKMQLHYRFIRNLPMKR